MKKPEEIKKALKLCSELCGKNCPYHGDKEDYECQALLADDALVLIKRLEAQLARHENLIVDVLKEMAE